MMSLTRPRLTIRPDPSWAHEGTGVKFDGQFWNDPEYRRSAARIINEWAKELPFPAESILPDRYAVGIPQSWIITLASFGSKILYYDGDHPKAQLYPLKDIQRPEEVVVPDLTQVPPMSDYLRQFRELVERYGREQVAFLSEPYVGDVAANFAHSPLTLAHQLRGEQFFIDLVENPPMARALIDASRDVVIQLFALVARENNITINRIPMACCPATWVGQKVWRATDLPEVRKLITHFGGRATLHSCGPSTHMLSAFAELPGLFELELGFGTDMGQARRLWPEASLVYEMDPALVLYQSPDEIASEVSQVITSAGPGPLNIRVVAAAGTPLSAIEALRDTVERGPSF